ncbi:MAG: dTDP-glucose 4,6-dehydratase [Bacteroidetes bacterium]|nr:dTDP-glucose 4,6-dehydratase [Bacteroidota bacterium]
MKNILLTGGAGFIGSHLVKWLLNKYPYKVVNLDMLTYAGNLGNLQEVEQHPNYVFEKGDIGNAQLLDRIMEEHAITHVIHLAAESHVDRSIVDPLAFVQTNVLGTVQLLNACRRHWPAGTSDRLFYHVSTDEVYGSLPSAGYFVESTPYDPRSPYSASKAASDHFVRAYFHTYGLPVVLSNCSNNYGPYQFPEKLIPLMINNIKHGNPLPVYGQGLNIRDWLWVEDHCAAIDVILHGGKVGETYNIGGMNEWKNIDLVHLLCHTMDHKLGRKEGESAKLITYVKDRAGHDLRYAIDPGKLREHLGWSPSIDFETGLARTVDWYLDNEAWLEAVTSGAYLDYYQHQYAHR